LNQWSAYALITRRLRGGQIRGQGQWLYSRSATIKTQFPIIRFVDPMNEPTDPRPPGDGSRTDKKLSDFMFDNPAKPNVKPAGPKRIVSQLDEGQLVNRVEPVYPHIAAISGIQGQVKLHAIIGRDGRIQSLNAISGHPLLLRAALDAVEQWRYRPYMLNGERVEVETFITVNFKKGMH
jgi:TonB family protein